MRTPQEGYVVSLTEEALEVDPAFDTDERPAWGNRGGPGVPVAGSGADAARRLYRLHRRHQALRARSQSGTAGPAWVQIAKRRIVGATRT